MATAIESEAAAITAPPEHLRFAAILDQMPVGIGIFDDTGRLFHSNRHFERAAGGAIPSIHSMTGTFWQAFLPDGTELEEQSWPGHRALKGQIATPVVDFIRRTADGERWVGVSAVPLTEPGASRVVGAVVVVEDIEERRRTVAQLEAQQARFARFAHYSSNALWIADVETGAFDFLSPAAERLWADRGGIATLGEWIESVHPDDRARAAECRRMAIDGDAQRFEYRIVDGLGATMRHVRETSFPIPGAPGEHDCIGAILEDISPEAQIYLVQHAGHDGSDLIEELRQTGRRTKTFARQEDLMNVADVLNPGCVVVDMRGVGVTAQAIAGVLQNRPSDLQVIFIGHAETPASQVIEAMRAGARDYLLTPLVPGELARAVHAATQALPARYEALETERHELAHRFACLPKREREVLLGLLAGGTNKTIARTLGISPRTVEVHRAHLMDRLGVRTLSELLRLAHDAGIRST